MQATLWMMGTLLSFSLMAIGARELSSEMGTPQTLFFRSVIGLLVVSGFILLSKQTALFQTLHIKKHAFRNLFHFGGQYGWFVGIGLLPLANVFALEFTVPIWTLVIAVLALGERVTLHKVLAIALGLLGVLVILKPGLEIIDASALIVLASAFCYGVSHATTKSISQHDHAMTILFYMCLIQLPIGLLLALTHWVWPSGVQWLWLLLIGMTALSAHYCMVKAMHHADASTVVTLDFLRLPLIALVGIVLYAEPFELSLILGGLLMLMGNIISLRGQRKYRSENG